MNTVEHRAGTDRCPGVLRPHYAEDGALLRLRIPGGQTTASVLLELSRISTAFGEGSVQLTSRANVQLRGLDEQRLPDLEDRISALGLLPSLTHERVRNIVASPLTGLSGARPDLRPLVAELDEAVCGTPELADLPGRFLFAVDDGRGDVVSLAFDLAFLATSEQTGLVLVGDRQHGVETGLGDAASVMVKLEV